LHLWPIAFFTASTWRPKSNEALHQTKWQGPEVTPINWVTQVIKRLENIDWPKAVDDVRPLIEREADLNQLTRESVLKLLEYRHLTDFRQLIF